MNSVRRLHRNAPGLFQVVAACVMLPWLMAMAMAVSPELHEHVHEDAGHADHECVVTHLQAGDFSDAAPPPFFLVLPTVRHTEESLAIAPDSWVQPLFLKNGVLEHGPPAQ